MALTKTHGRMAEDAQNPIADAGGYYSSTTVEGALQEIGAVSFTGPLGQLYADALPVGEIEIPATFNNTLGASIYWDGSAVQYDTAPYDLMDFEKYDAVNDYYVNYATGNNASAGTSSGAAWKTFDYAIANATSPAVIHLEDNLVGILSRSTLITIFTGKLKLKGEGPSGRTIIAAMREDDTKAAFSWAATGSSNAYKSSTASARHYRCQLDGNYRNAQGIPRPMNAAASAAVCESTPGTFFWDSGASELYVHMWDGREPDPADGWLYGQSAFDFEIQNGGATADDIILVENCEFVSHVGATPTGAGFRYRPFTTGSVNSAKLGLKNCLVYGHSDNGFEIYDADVVVMQNCHAWYNHVDGLNYHSFITTGTRGEYMTVYEHNCTAFNNGWEGWADQTALSASANGSTAHDSMHIIRTNTVAGMNNGAVIADVNGTHTLCYNVTAARPDEGGTANPKACFWHEKYLGFGTTKIMYLWGCSAHTDEDASVSVINNTAQSGGSANNGEIRVKYWKGQKTSQVVGTIYDWSGTPIT